RIHKEFAEHGVHVLDAPVSGGPHGAQRGTLQVMVGGDEAIYERVRPALLAIGDKVSYIGDIGSGEIAKLVHNMVSYCASLALAEQALIQGLVRGWGDKDSSAIFMLQEERAGVEVRTE